jgi:hypothetical protein
VRFRTRSNGATRSHHPATPGTPLAPRREPLGAIVGNQAARRLLSPRPILFPHQSAINRSLGVSMPFRAVHDPIGCTRAGSRAFTDGDRTHFSDAHPDLHVAAHEAMHQAQHAGLTNDSGLGAEGQACAAADLIRAGRSAARLIGGRGDRVPVARRHYTLTDKTGRWKGIEGGAVIGKLSDTGESLTFHSHEAFATPSLIASAAAILKAKKSGLEISDGGPGPQVEAPNGSGFKPLSKVALKQVADPASDKYYADCGRMAREVMGPTGSDTPASVVCAPGGVPRVIQPDITNKAALEHMALLLFIDQRIREAPGSATMSQEDKKQIADKATAEYHALPEKEKQDFIRKQLQQGRIPAGTAEQIGVNEYARPGVGEAFTIVRRNEPSQKEWAYHWAAVIMAPGEDRVTFENAAETSEYNAKNEKWYIETYGPPTKLGQTYHEEWAKYFGTNPMTLTARTQPPPPADAADLPSKSTPELLARYANTTPEDQHFIKQELAKRFVKATVQVIKKQDIFVDDDVYLVFAVGDKGVSTGKQAFGKGQTKTFTIPISQLLPVPSPLVVKVYEYDYLLPDDLIGTLYWSAPYSELTRDATERNAHYKVTLSL